MFSTIRLGHVAFILSLAVFLATTFYRYSPLTIGFTEDMALSMAVGSSIIDGEKVILGPPSHTGGRHLGPVGYWYVAAGLALTDSDYYSTFFVITLVEALAVLVLSVLGAFLATKSLEWWYASGVLLASCTFQYGLVLRYPWHNHFLIVPSTFFLCCAYFCFKYGIKALPLYLLSASLLIQFHYSNLPLVAGVSSIVLLWFFRTGKTPLKLSWNAPSVVVYLLTLASWIPLLIYEVTYGDTLLKVFSPHTMGAQSHAGLTSSAGEIFKFFKVFWLGFDFIPDKLEAYRWTLLLFVAVLSVVMLIRVMMCASSLTRIFLWSIFSSLILYLIMLAYIPPPLFPSYLYGMIPIPALFGGMMLGQAVHDLRAKRSSCRWLSYLFLVFFIFSLTKQLSQRIGYPFSSPIFHSLKHVYEVIDLINHDRAGLPITIITKSQSQVMRDPFLFLLGREYFSKINYWDQILELQQIKPPESELAYLVACPRPWSKALTEIEKGMEATWRPEYELFLGECETCKGCLVKRYGRRVLNLIIHPLGALGTVSRSLEAGIE